MLIYFLINYVQAVPTTPKETAGVEELVTATVICSLVIGPSHRLLWQYHHQILQGNFQVASISRRKKKTKENITKRKKAQGFLGARVCGISQEFFSLKSTVISQL